MEPRYNFHLLRHFHASMLIADGANPKEVQAEMGHNSIQVTYDLYGHLFKDEDADRRRKERANDWRNARLKLHATYLAILQHGD